MKPHLTIPITDCGEPLVPVAGPHIVLTDPHPYEALGAPYGGRSPWMLREGVLAALNRAALALHSEHPGHRILLTDAFRPISVQRFMVEHTFASLARREGLDAQRIPNEDRTRLMHEVLRFWAEPSEDPKTPPPHSTGSALDCTLIDPNGRPLPMGGEIDDVAEHSLPLHFAGAASEPEITWNGNRELLHRVMHGQGFRRHKGEWWHFSLGDQMWAWQLREEEPGNAVVARYGRA
jgi:D-alanyl-D-alanine dipeptidase